MGQIKRYQLDVNMLIGSVSHVRFQRAPGHPKRMRGGKMGVKKGQLMRHIFLLPVPAAPHPKLVPSKLSLIFICFTRRCVAAKGTPVVCNHSYAVLLKRGKNRSISRSAACTRFSIFRCLDCALCTCFTPYLGQPTPYTPSMWPANPSMQSPKSRISAVSAGRYFLSTAWTGFGLSLANPNAQTTLLTPYLGQPKPYIPSTRLANPSMQSPQLRVLGSPFGGYFGGGLHTDGLACHRPTATRTNSPHTISRSTQTLHSVHATGKPFYAVPPITYFGIFHQAGTFGTFG
jgi:hypothetical protein